MLFILPILIFTTIKKLSLESRESLQDEKDQDEFRKIKNWKRSEVIKDFKFYIISLNMLAMPWIATEFLFTNLLYPTQNYGMLI